MKIEQRPEQLENRSKNMTAALRLMAAAMCTVVIAPAFTSLTNKLILDRNNCYR